MSLLISQTAWHIGGKSIFQILNFLGNITRILCSNANYRFSSVARCSQLSDTDKQILFLKCSSLSETILECCISILTMIFGTSLMLPNSHSQSSKQKCFICSRLSETWIKCFLKSHWAGTTLTHKRVKSFLKCSSLLKPLIQCAFK